MAILETCRKKYSVVCGLPTTTFL
uniref:Uncharacterized protein n=1 Tax=Anguilla anguilla TaxID=7936 RepID=A0A0E9VR81_ANGAN